MKSEAENPSKEIKTKNIAILKNVNKNYKMGEVIIHALRNINLEIKDGELLAILGPSGSGKTTMLNILGGIDLPTSGQIYLDGDDISKYKRRKLTYLRREKIGFVFQFFNLIPTLTAKENVEFAIELASRDKVPPSSNAVTLLDKVGLKDRINHFPSKLSGGEQQRVAVARALAKDPVMVLGDEPTGNLDFRMGKLVLQTLKELNDEGKTVVVVTHNTPIAQMADRIIYLHDGQISKEEINKQPKPIDDIVW